jgi:hypothetical protein
VKKYKITPDLSAQVHGNNTPLCDRNSQIKREFVDGSTVGILSDGGRDNDLRPWQINFQAQISKSSCDIFYFVFFIIVMNLQAYVGKELIQSSQAYTIDG